MRSVRGGFRWLVVGQLVVASAALGLIGASLLLAARSPATDYADSPCPPLVPVPHDTSGCSQPMADRAVQATAAFATGVLGLFAAARLGRLDFRGWARGFARSMVAGLITAGMAIAAVKVTEQSEHF